VRNDIVQYMAFVWGELILVLGSLQVTCHKPDGRLPLLSASPAVTPTTLKRLLPVLLLGEQRHNGCEQFA